MWRAFFFSLNEHIAFFVCMHIKLIDCYSVVSENLYSFLTPHSTYCRFTAREGPSEGCEYSSMSVCMWCCSHADSCGRFMGKCWLQTKTLSWLDGLCRGEQRMKGSEGGLVAVVILVLGWGVISWLTRLVTYTAAVFSCVRHVRTIPLSVLIMAD